MSNIAVIGGSFNPITLAHMQIGALVATIPCIDMVFYVPNFNSVFGKNLAAFHHRVKMVDKVVNTLNSIQFEKWFMTCSIECEQNLDGYTVSLVSALKKAYPKDTFFFVIGQDIANSIDSYKHYDTLIRDEKFIIVPRPGYTPTGNWYMNNKHICLQIDAPLIDVSSTHVRTQIVNGNILSLIDKLPTDVLQYIMRNKLFTCND